MLWSKLRRGNTEQRLDQNAWGQMYGDVMTFGGNTYPLGMMPRSSGNTESIANDFVGYSQGAYKASGVVFACMVARMLVFSEARFQYQTLNNGRPGDLFGSKELAVLETPWPNGTTGELLCRALQDTDLGGNHYVLREGVGAGSRLRRLRPDWVDIILTASPDVAVASDVAGYVYKPGGTDNPDLWEIYPIDGSNGVVAHWSPIPDPEAQYRGMSWLTPVLREIQSDKSATRHKQAFFDNAATPALSVSLSDQLTAEQFGSFMEKMNESKHGVEHAYETLYLGGGADVKVIGANLQQMDFKVTQGHGETRVAAAARIHPTLVGLAEGMHGSALNEGNFKAAKNAFADGTMRPLWRSLCAAYAPLVAEFRTARLWYDTRDIAFLRQDHADRAAIAQTEAATIASLVQSGYTPDSIVAAIKAEDWSLLTHTGLFSVQLLPPGTTAAPPGPNADSPDSGPADQAAPDDQEPDPPAKPAA